MSKRIASIHFYDALDSVIGSAVVREYDDYDNGTSEITFNCAMKFPGHGDDETADWLARCLQELRRTL